MSADKPHWICRVMDCVSSPGWWDGLILGLAVGLGVPVIVWLWLTGN